jgi:mono/diheme cytochrome c family protein
MLPIITLLSLAPLQFSIAADYFNGRQVYEMHCQACHGVDGRSMVPGTPDFTNGDALFRPDTELFQQIREGKGVMPAFRGMLSDSEIRDVIAYVRSLQY